MSYAASAGTSGGVETSSVSAQAYCLSLFSQTQNRETTLQPPSALPGASPVTVTKLRLPGDEECKKYRWRFHFTCSNRDSAAG